MGIASWMLTGIVSGLLASLLPFGRITREERGRHMAPLFRECLIGAIAALFAGFLATALDFGGTREIDPRAALFTLSVALAAIGASRAIRQMSGKGLKRTK